ncbi:T9SS type A sorting domain-containing protein [Ichthyenterobacterium sp. W332]|uniref:T9SS type A sorting domain-containing protein n=1 Tax=Microcosmobacter mediterraneus TaxID=3075607 RepID=A0ABU2YIR8_9FLAO|nr:ELWxxDGT repeat protein [Ichthyenterobacterium sp. W332]MDT0557564.1 T9SS type A sorting domain-containing protein [Ichthyenterobacterium sp. W332]
MKQKLLITFLFVNTILYSQTSLVKDIIPIAGIGSITTNSEFQPFNNMILFEGLDQNFGFELYVSDGTTSGTILLKDINAGFSNSNPSNFFHFGGTNEVFFAATSANEGRELWKTNGTNSGTVLVKDIRAGSSLNSNPDNFIAFNGELFFTSDNTNGRQLTKTNGTNSGTDFVPNTTTLINPEELIVFNNELYFRSYKIGVQNKGIELYKLNSSYAEELVLDINTTSATANSTPQNLVVFNNKLYFTANDGINGRELWATDGTSAGTYLVADLLSGSSGSIPRNLTVWGNRLYFSATSSTNGTELYYMTTTESIILHKDVNPGATNGSPENFFPFNGKLYFTADNGQNGRELWSTDGSIFGVNLAADINTGISSSNPEGFSIYNSILYFTAEDDTNGIELWSTDGTTAGTELVDNINTSNSSSPEGLIVINNNLLFHADDGINGRELWRYLDPTLSIPLEQTVFNYTIIPNPVEDSFIIEGRQHITLIEFFDTNGKFVKDIPNPISSYNASDLKSGVYFIVIHSNQGKVIKKLIKL